MKCFLTSIKKPFPSNVLLIMKLTAAFFLFFTLNVSAHGFGQERINLRVKKAEISDVLRTIEKQTNYRFLYNNDLEGIREKVSITVKNAELAEVLDIVLKKTRLLYQVMNNNLIVIKENESAPEVPDVEIRGRVTSDAGVALVGASVVVKGTTMGTTTNTEGQFSLRAPDANVTLVISSVGFDAQEIALAGRTEISVTLVTSTKVMDQVVVVGYGTQRRRAVTGAISTVNGDQIARQPLTTPIQGVQGLAPGIQVTGSSQPGAQPRVTIRGLNTILTNENPLYVVDGVLTEDITNINSMDVLSIDILKDGAAAIYGSRAANGVILITTKKGRSGKANVSFESYFGFRKLTNIVKMADRNLYLAYTNEARAYDGTTTPIATLDASSNTDWFDEISRDGALQNYNLSVNGGTDNVSYLFSAGYLNDKGVLLGADYKRITLRLNNEYRVARFLKFGNVLNTSIIKSTNKPNGVFSDAYRASPAAPVHDATGNYGYQPGVSAVGNPVANLELTNDFGRGQRFQGNLYGEVTLTKGLTFRTTWGFDYENGGKREYSPVYSYGTFSKTVSELFLEDINRFYWVLDNILNYRKVINNDHNIEVTLGQSSEKDKRNNTTIRATNVPPEKNLWYITQGDPTITLVGTRTGASNLQRTSYFGRLSYGFKDKYNLSGVIRRDGSSAFPVNEKWGTFYSIAGSWIISEESFLNNSKLFDFLKLRGGYAQLGNDGISRIVNNELATLTSVTITNPYGAPGGLWPGITINQIKDAQATWETTKSVDLGIEFGMMGRKLTGEVSYYNKLTNAYIHVPTFSVVDPDGILAQAADVRNQGVEFQLGWNTKAGDDWSYRISANATVNKNNVEKVEGGIDLKEGGLGNGQVTTSTVEGKPIGSFWVYQVEGVFQTQAEVDAAPHVTGTMAGDFKYTDFNKDGFIDERDRIFVGAYQPKFYYGINGGFNWKQLDFTIDCYGNAGNKVYNGKKAVRFGNENIEAARGNRWTASNHSTTEYRASNAIPVPSTYFVESGSFFRINNITIGYTLPASMSNRAYMTSTRFFVSAQNPLIWKKFSGFSPELQGSNALNSGIELNVYPIVATYMIGVNVNFK